MNNIRSTLYISLFLSLVEGIFVQSFEYNDCTEKISKNIIDNNNGILQLEYTHYPGFWLSQVVKQSKKVLQWRFLAKEENFDLSPSFVTIMDTISHSNVANAQDSYVGYLWSWKLISKHY